VFVNIQVLFVLEELSQTFACLRFSKLVLDPVGARSMVVEEPSARVAASLLDMGLVLEHFCVDVDFRHFIFKAIFKRLLQVFILDCLIDFLLQVIWVARVDCFIVEKLVVDSLLLFVERLALTKAEFFNVLLLFLQLFVITSFKLCVNFLLTFSFLFRLTHSSSPLDILHLKCVKSVRELC